MRNIDWCFGKCLGDQEKFQLESKESSSSVNN